MKYIKGIFAFLVVLSFASCDSDKFNIEDYYGNRDAGIAFLEENKDKEGVTTTSSGLQYEVIEEGEGEFTQEVDVVKTRYKSSLIDGTTLYNNMSADIEEIAYSQVNFLLDGVIEGLKLMNVGSTYKFYIPYELAYGEFKIGSEIDPFSVVIVEIELVENFFTDNAQKEGVFVTGSGLQYEIIEEVEGDYPLEDSKVKVHYHGTTIEGQVFDSSVDRGAPSEFYVNQVIDGWVEGLQLMTPGSKYKFYIPYDLAYGENGNGAIPPFAPLIFEIELIEIL